jgi:hypothetical protein
MKKIIVFALLLITANASFSQQNNPSQALSKQDYLLKSKHQKTTAWILLSGGLLSTGLGSLRLEPHDDWGGGNNKPTTASTIFLVTGLAAIGTSIPLFISAAINKKKAISVSFKNEISPQVYKNSFVYKPVPSLTLKISL